MPVCTCRHFRTIAAILLGTAIFVLLFGLQPLVPYNMDWFREGDPFQAWLGWSFFRNAPWTLPPGLNPSYGLELHNAIVYTDSIPLLAFIFKPFSRWLPDVFQYGGYWLLGCCILQAYFASKLIALHTSNIWCVLCGCALFLFQPIFFFRMNQHFTLVGQFLILAALYLYFRPRRAGAITWSLLLGSCALIHAYLLVMCGFIWLADMTRQFIHHHATNKFLWLRAGITVAVTVLCCWAAGYFAIKVGGSGGFGLYKMNLLAPFDPDNGSLLFQDLPSGEGDYEGYAWLGGGGLLLLVWLIPLALAGRCHIFAALNRHWPLFAACICLTLLAVSHNVAVGSHVFTFPLPKFLTHFMDVTFRSAGRFFWPVTYLLLLFTIAKITSNFPVKIAGCLLGIALAAQMVDTWPLWGSIRHLNNNYSIAEKFKDPLWRNAPYDKIRHLPFGNVLPGWSEVGMFAALNGKGTDYVYVSRTDDARVAEINRKNEEMLASGRFDPNTLYVLDEETYNRIKRMPRTGFLGIVDGFRIFLPAQGKPG